MRHQIRRSLPVAVIGSDNLYNMVRAALVARGTNLNQWCKANRINRQTVDKALKGERIGRRAQTLRDHIVSELFPQSDHAA